MSKVEWIKCEDRMPDRKGFYLIAYVWPPSVEVLADVQEFSRKGDVVMYRSPERIPGETEEERLAKVLFGEGLEEFAPKDGFYCHDDDHYWELRPTHWAELPEAPDGLKWMGA